MKKCIIIFVMLLSSVAFLISTAKAGIVDISIGGAAWFNWWRPAWEGGKVLSYNPPKSEIQVQDLPNFKMDPSFFYGPILSIRLYDRIALSSVFLYGDYYAETKVVGVTPIAPLVFNYKRKIKKYDSDSSLTVFINRYFRIYVGFKYQGYDYRELVTLRMASIIADSILKNTVRSYGPALGIGFFIPIYENLFGLVNASGLVLWGRERYRTKKLYSTAASSTPTITPDGKFLTYGGNFTGSLAYLIEKVNITISLGFRYQVLHYDQSFRNGEYGGNIIDGEFDHIYGIIMNMVYTFELGKLEKKP